jgi:hypothetical protein
LAGGEAAELDGRATIFFLFGLRLQRARRLARFVFGATGHFVRLLELGGELLN